MAPKLTKKAGINPCFNPLLTVSIVIGPRADVIEMPNIIFCNTGIILLCLRGEV